MHSERCGWQIKGVCKRTTKVSVSEGIERSLQMWNLVSLSTTVDLCVELVLGQRQNRIKKTESEGLQNETEQLKTEAASV